jgi:hypothetical protein
MKIAKAKLYHIIKEEVEKLIKEVNITGMGEDASNADAWAAAGDNPGTYIVAGDSRADRGEVASNISANDAALLSWLDNQRLDKNPLAALQQGMGYPLSSADESADIIDMPAYEEVAGYTTPEGAYVGGETKVLSPGMSMAPDLDIYRRDWRTQGSNDAALAQGLYFERLLKEEMDQDVYYIRRSGYHDHESYLKPTYATATEPAWGSLDQAKKFKGESSEEALLWAEEEIKHWPNEDISGWKLVRRNS